MDGWPNLALVAICALFAICFTQSGIDKLTDFKGNLDWLNGHFANSPFKNVVPLLLRAITFLEIWAGAVSLGAIPCIMINKFPLVPVVAMGLCCIALLSLFLGQRIAKDYAGAASLVPYFLAACFGLYLALEPAEVESHDTRRIEVARTNA